MRHFTLAAAMSAVLAVPASAKSLDEMFPNAADVYVPEALALIQNMDFKQGKITLGNGIAELDVPEGYYYLAPGDARIVLETIWGNPVDMLGLGMIFPASVTPLDAEAWGVDISFDDIGYVSDEDASDYDYDELLETMKKDTREASKYRIENGFGSIELIGWAAQPHYDTVERKLHWAKELEFGGDAENRTLNYNLRVLGRKGVLVQNFIAGMDQVDVVSAALPDIAAMTSFTSGNTYAEFDPEIDKVAAVGIGGLIAGKVLAKTGFLAIALVFLKKFWFLIFIPLVALKGLFTRKKSG